MRTSAALGFLLALTIGMYWKLTLSGNYTWLENPDQAFQVRPWLDYEAREIHAGRLPLWDPYQLGGQTLIGQVQPGLANPLNWILFAMPLRDGHIPLGTLHWYWVLIRWVAAAFAYWLCRDLGASVWASLLGASIFAFSGFVGQTGTPQFLMSGIWTPLVLLFFARLFRGERVLANAACCGAVLGAAFLSGHHNVPIYTAVLLGILWTWYLATRWRNPRAWAAAAIFAAICPMVSAVQVLPAVEYGRLALRWVGAPEAQRWHDKVPYHVHAEYSLKAPALAGLVTYVPGVQSDPLVGVVALALALTAIALRGRSRDVPLLAMAALGGLMLALGSTTPLQPLTYRLIPMVDKARYPAMAIVLFQCAIAALGALGLDAWLQRDEPSGLSTRRKAILGGLLGFAITYYVLRAGEPLSIGRALPAAVAVMLAVALFSRRMAPVLALSLFLVEAAAHPFPAIRQRDVTGSFLKQVTDQADLADFLKRQSGWFRISMAENEIPYNFGDWNGIEHLGGYLASMPENVNRAWGSESTPRLFGLQYHVASTPSAPEQVEVFQSQSGIRIYRDPRIGQPLFAVHDLPCGDPDRLRVLSRVPNATVIDAHLGCPGLVVIGDPWFPGWRAAVDGRPVRIQEFEQVVRAVPVGAGSHRIELRYVPGSVYGGAGLTLLGLLLTGSLCAHGRTR